MEIQSLALTLRLQYPSSTLSLPDLLLSFTTTRDMPNFTLSEDTEPRAPPAALSQLCDKCSVLSFDDAWFGYEEEGVLEPEKGRILELEYDQRDTLPDLPILRASAAAGCAFCAALREATLGLQLGGPADIEYQLEFTWGMDDEDFVHIGLYLLVATVFLKLRQETHNESTTHKIVFNIDSEGRLHIPHSRSP